MLISVMDDRTARDGGWTSSSSTFGDRHRVHGAMSCRARERRQPDCLLLRPRRIRAISADAHAGANEFLTFPPPDSDFQRSCRAPRGARPRLGTVEHDGVLRARGRAMTMLAV
jgi:hypothetical protein